MAVPDISRSNMHCGTRGEVFSEARDNVFITFFTSNNNFLEEIYVDGLLKTSLMSLTRNN